MISARIFMVLLFVSWTSVQALGQGDKTEAEVRELVETKHFVFHALSVTPQQGRMQQLTPGYDLVISGDSLIAFLPYFGRAFTAPINPTDGGIKFTSAKYEYNLSKFRKKRWEIKLQPSDVQEVQTLYLTVYNNGRANLRVNSTNRQSISFNGYIEEGAPWKKKAF